LAADGGATGDFTFIERYRGAPDLGLPPPANEPGLRVAAQGGEITLRCGLAPGEAADIEVESEWEDALRGYSLPHGADYDRFMAWRLGNGRLRIHGDITRLPRVLALAHDPIAARTEDHRHPYRSE
jgi:hypothetical protein